MCNVLRMASSSLAGVWSATPTPFHSDLSLDFESIAALVEQHIDLGVKGFMLGGTCGEGPWMPTSELVDLTKSATEKAAGRLGIAVQVTDNSAKRMLSHIEKVAKVGAQYAVVASPYFLINATPRRILDLYLEVVRQSPIPVGFYDRGKHATYVVENDLLPELLAEPNLHIVKDSSADLERRDLLLSGKKQRPELALFNGDEFNCASYIEAGYDGLLVGGGIFNGRIAAQIITAVQAGDMKKAGLLQERMNELMYRVYGGKKIACWLTGLKYLLVRMGVFQSEGSYLGYPLTDECRAAIDEIVVGDDKDGYRADLLSVTASAK